MPDNFPINLPLQRQADGSPCSGLNSLRQWNPLAHLIPGSLR